jgi:hypothetical protein
MTLETLTVPKDVARRKLNAVRRELARRRKPIDDEIAQIEKAFEVAAAGTPVIQLSQAIAAGGFFSSGLPRIAVARSDKLRVDATVNRWRGEVEYSWLRRKGGWDRDTLTVGLGTRLTGESVTGTTIVPLVPSDALEAAGVTRSTLRRYLTLFEVEAWKPVPPVDPALLKHIAGDLYAVLAVWDLTELERAVIAGR